MSPHTIEFDIGVPARGWHGEAYRGHIFWDELFIFPFLTLRLPMLTRALLRYRYRRLPEARRAAQAAGYAGAMYPWQSGSNGREETQTLPESALRALDSRSPHRQRHINVAIAYNIWQYYQVTEDHEFLSFYGAEMLLEIARFWASIATYNSSIDRYEITGVMGPDEYHTAYPGADPAAAGGIHNNAYTNVMVAWVLERAPRRARVVAPGALPPALRAPGPDGRGPGAVGRAQSQTAGAVARRRHHQPVRRLRRLGAVRLARLPGALRQYPAPGSDPRSRI